MADRNNGIESVVRAALAIADARERARYIEKACAGDAALRARVEKSLAGKAEAGGSPSSDETIATPGRATRGSASSMTTIDAGLADSALPSEKPGAVIGRYKLLQQIGEGGFGVVYLAEQEQPVRRQVALKIIKLGMDTKQVIARFEAERQALALMDHPHIAKVFDAGATATGRPFFVMEMVKGLPITDYCDRERVPLRDRLTLFTSVCGAVQHAHLKGIIHRDLKPSNILVTPPTPSLVKGGTGGVGEVKVIDFGIAKATQQRLTERTMVTGFGQFMGTPAYMSPEQAELGGLDIDTRSDVYALGVVLYELLTGATPFDLRTLSAGSVDEIRRIIREEEPSKPSTRLSKAGEQLTALAQRRGIESKKLGTLLRGDLDWIVMKAMEKDRRRRYESASALASDIQRYLDGDAVLAAPPSTAYRLRKFVRRNKGVVTAGGTVGAALLIGLVAFAWQARIAHQQRALADEQRDRARIEAAKAEKTTEFLTSIFGGLDPYNSKGADTTLLRELLGDMNTRIAQELNGQPEVQGALRHTLARAYLGLGQYDHAMTQVDAALELQTAALGENHPQTLKTQATRATVLERLGRHAEAEALIRAMLAAKRKIRSEDDAESLRMMVQLGSVQSRIGKFAEAEKTLRSALSRQTQLLGADHRATLATTLSLASTLSRQDRSSEAEKLAKRVVERRGGLLGADDPETFEAKAALAAILKFTGKRAEAEAYEREALEGLTRKLGPDNPQTMNVRDNLAGTFWETERFEEAETLFRDNLERRRRVLGDEAVETLFSVANLGGFLQETGRPDEAEPLIRQALEGRRRLLGEEHADTIVSMTRLGMLLKERGDYGEAVEWLQRCVAAERKNRRESDPTIGRSLYNWAATLQTGKQHAAAEPIFREVLALREKYKHRDEPFIAAALNGLAKCLDARGDTAEAEEYFQKGLAVRRRLYSKPNRDLAYSLEDYGSRLLKWKNAAAAEPLLRENLSVLRETLPEGAWEVGDAMSLLGSCLVAEALFTEAEPLLLEGYARIRDDPRAKSSVVTEARARVVHLYESWSSAEPNAENAERLARWTKADGN